MRAWFARECACDGTRQIPARLCVHARKIKVYDVRAKSTYVYDVRAREIKVRVRIACVQNQGV